MKQGNLKGKHAILILLGILAAISMAQVRAEEEYNVIATLEPSNPQGFGKFGGDFALSGDLLLIGERWGHVEEVGGAGKAYLYDTDWNLLLTLQAPEPETPAEFGRSVDILGDVMVVGCHLARVEDLVCAGKVYVFDSDGSLQFTLQSPDPRINRHFGIEVALGKDVILVAETGGVVQDFLRAGVVHVYNTEGVYLTTLTSPSMKNNGLFGYKLEANEEFILVGEPGEHDNPPFVIGSVHVFDYDWNLVTTFQAPEQEVRTGFGVCIAIRGETVVIGEVWDDVEGVERAGRAYIFDTDWNHLATLQSTAPIAGGDFGKSTAIGGDLIMVSEPRANVVVNNEGKVYVFDLEGNLVFTLQSPDPTIGAQFGYYIVTDGEIIVVADIEATVERVSKAGKVHVFGVGEPAAEQKPEPEQKPAEAVTEPGEEPSFWDRIPGFQYESIILGLIAGVVMLWLLQRKQ